MLGSVWFVRSRAISLAKTRLEIPQNRHSIAVAMLARLNAPKIRKNNPVRIIWNFSGINPSEISSSVRNCLSNANTVY
jgi:hypothetical protein